MIKSFCINVVGPLIAVMVVSMFLMLGFVLVLKILNIKDAPAQCTCVCPQQEWSP